MVRPQARAAADRAARERLAAVTGNQAGAADAGADGKGAGAGAGVAANELPDAPVSHAERLAGSLRQNKNKDTKRGRMNHRMMMARRPKKKNVRGEQMSIEGRGL